MILLSCRPSVLESKYLTFNELAVGQTLIKFTKWWSDCKLRELISGFKDRAAATIACRAIDFVQEEILESIFKAYLNFLIMLTFLN